MCVTGCGEADEVEIAWQVGNQGSVATASATLELHVDRGGTGTLAASVPIPAIDPGIMPEGGVFSLPATTFAGATGYTLRLVDTSGTECDPSNDEVVVTSAVCP
jgi:hypothetical protein